MKLHSGRVDCILGGCGAFWAGAFFESIYIHRESIEINGYTRCTFKPGFRILYNWILGGCTVVWADLHPPQAYKTSFWEGVCGILELVFGCPGLFLRPSSFRVYTSLIHHCQTSNCLMRSESSRLNECTGAHSSQGFVYYTIEFWEGARWSGRICIRPKHIKHHSGRECVAFWSLFSVALVFFFAPALIFHPGGSHRQISNSLRPSEWFRFAISMGARVNIQARVSCSH